MALQQRHTSREFSAGGIVYKEENGEKFYLVTQHSQNKHWSFPKGLIGDKKDGEEKEETAIREVLEEGGIHAEIIKDKPFVNSYFYTFNGVKIFKTVYFFLMKYISGNIEDHDFEVSEAKWLREDEVVGQLSFSADKKMFKDAVLLLQ